MMNAQYFKVKRNYGVFLLWHAAILAMVSLRLTDRYADLFPVHITSCIPMIRFSTRRVLDS
jgi:hypothetical protein